MRCVHICLFFIQFVFSLRLHRHTLSLSLSLCVFCVFAVYYSSYIGHLIADIMVYIHERISNHARHTRIFAMDSGYTLFLSHLDYRLILTFIIGHSKTPPTFLLFSLSITLSLLLVLSAVLCHTVRRRRHDDDDDGNDGVATMRQRKSKSRCVLRW